MPWENSRVMVLVVYALIVAVGIAVILRLS